jgi:hypothetical protein
MSDSQPIEELLRRTYRVVADLPDTDVAPRAVPHRHPDPASVGRPRLRRHGVLITVAVLLAASVGVGHVLVGTRSAPVTKKTAPPVSKHQTSPPAATSGVVTVPNDTSACSPTTSPGSSGGPAASLTAAGTEVAHGTVGGQNWTLWSAEGQSGATGIENGGLVIGGRAYGLCPGYPNPAEMELIDDGPSGLVAGVVGYPGLAKVSLSESSAGTFDVGRALPAPSVQVVDGVSFFIGTLPRSACDYGSIELNTTSPGVSAEHNLGFGTCVVDQIVPISESQGIWQLPPGQFQTSFGNAATGAGAADVPANNSGCSPPTSPASSGGPAGSLTALDTEVAHGAVGGQDWSLWSAKGQSGADGIEDGGLVLDGLAYGLCPGYPNPAEMELIDNGPTGVVAGVVGYPGRATVSLSESTAGTFDVGAALPAPSVRVVNGDSFFIGTLPRSACDYGSIELNTTSPGVSAEHNLGFGTCGANQLVPISESQGIWQLPPGQFQTDFANAGPGPGSTATGAGTSTTGTGSVSVPDDTSDCSSTTSPASSGAPASSLTSTGTEVASGSVGGEAWSLWSAKGQSGATGIENGGLVIAGRAYGLCPGYPNPAEMQLIDAGPDGLVAGIVGYPGLATVALSESTAGTFDVGAALPAPSVQVVDGVSFFIGTLPKSACDYPSLELNTTSPGVSAEHNLGFGTCAANQLVTISESQGIWQLPPGQFQSNF